MSSSLSCAPGVWGHSGLPCFCAPFEPASSLLPCAASAPGTITAWHRVMASFLAQPCLSPPLLPQSVHVAMHGTHLCCLFLPSCPICSELWPAPRRPPASQQP